MSGYLLVGIIVVLILFGLKREEWKRRNLEDLWPDRPVYRSTYRSMQTRAWLEKIWIVVKIGAFLFLLHLFLQMCSGRGF